MICEESFNAFNNVNFGVPNSTIGTQAAGTIAGTVVGPGGFFSEGDSGGCKSSELAVTIQRPARTQVRRGINAAS